MLRAIIILLIVMTNFGCDQVSKRIVRQTVPYEGNINFFHEHFLLTRVENPGAFLSMGNTLHGPVKFVVLTLLPLLALIIGLVMIIIRRHLSWIPLIAICFIIGGGIGNIYDRVVYGSVTDFLYVGYGALHTGIFNLADVSVTTGFILLLFYSTFKKDRVDSVVENL
jgi:signal peptidase II